jgi:hypothetical protein
MFAVNIHTLEGTHIQTHTDTQTQQFYQSLRKTQYFYEVFVHFLSLLKTLMRVLFFFFFFILLWEHLYSWCQMYSFSVCIRVPLHFFFFFYKLPAFHLFLYYSYKWVYNIWKFVLCSLIYYNPSCLCSTGFSFFRKNSPMCHLLLSYFPSGPFYMLPVCFFIFIILNFAIFMSVMRYNPKGGGCHHIYSLFACYSFFSSFKKHPCIWLEHTRACSSMRPIKF